MKKVTKIVLKHQKIFLAIASLCLSAAINEFFFPTQAAIYYTHLHYFPFAIMCIGTYILGRTAIKLFEKRALIHAAIFSAPLALTFVIGKKMHFGLDTVDPFFPADIIYFLAFWLICTAICLILLRKISVIRSTESQKPITKKAILKYAAIIFACWLPMFIIFFPGSGGGYDPFNQIAQILGTIPLQNHHPVIHTGFIGIFINLGLAINGSIWLGLALANLAQMIILSLILGYTVYRIKKMTTNKTLPILSLIFFALNPVIAQYAMTPWKDVFFGGALILLSLALYDLVKTQGEILKNKKYLAALILILILTALLRNNGLYVAIIIPIILIIIFRKKYWRQLLIVNAVVLATVLLFNTAVLPLLGIKQTSAKEALGIPLQQIGYVAKYGVMTPAQEEELATKFISREKIADAYIPYSPDNIKNNFGDDTYLSEHPGEFLKLWASILLTNGNIVDYVKAYLLNNPDYWHIGRTSWCCAYTNSQPDDFPASDDTGHRDINWLYDLTGYDVRGTVANIIEKLRLSHLLGWLYDTALSFWFLLFSVLVLIYTKRSKLIITLLPLLLVLVTLLVASPASGAFRYVFVFHAVLPLLFAIIQINPKKST